MSARTWVCALGYMESSDESTTTGALAFAELHTAPGTMQGAITGAAERDCNEKGMADVGGTDDSEADCIDFALSGVAILFNKSSSRSKSSRRGC